MAHGERWDLLETLHKRHGVGTRVRLDVAHRHIEALLLHGMGFFEHRVRLADPRGIAEEYLELAARIALRTLGLLDLPEDSVGIAPQLAVVRRVGHICPFNTAAIIAWELAGRYRIARGCGAIRWPRARGTREFRRA